MTSTKKIMMWSIFEIIHFWTAVVDESEEWSSQLIFQFKQLERRSLKKKTNQGFNGIRTRDLRVAGALLYQLSYEATHWERGQFIEFISPVRSEVYEVYESIWNNSYLVTGHGFGHGFESRWSPDFFFQASSFQLLKLENSLRWLFFTFIYNRSSNMNYFIYFT